MEQDIEKTQIAMGAPREKFAYPSIFYFENEKEEVQSVVLVQSEEVVVLLDSSGQTLLNPKHYTTNGDVHRMTVGSQSSARLFIVNGASENDIKRIIDKWSKTKYITLRK